MKFISYGFLIRMRNVLMWISINESKMEHAYQKMSIRKFWCMFWYRLKYLRRICVQDYAYMSSCYTGSWGGVKILPPPGARFFPWGSFEYTVKVGGGWGEGQKTKKKDLQEALQILEIIGAEGQNRTADTGIFSLSQGFSRFFTFLHNVVFVFILSMCY